MLEVEDRREGARVGGRMGEEEEEGAAIEEKEGAE